MPFIEYPTCLSEFKRSDFSPQSCECYLILNFMIDRRVESELLQSERQTRRSKEPNFVILR
jgi:hypothetical protein